MTTQFFRRSISTWHQDFLARMGGCICDQTQLSDHFEDNLDTIDVQSCYFPAPVFRLCFRCPCKFRTAHRIVFLQKQSLSKRYTRIFGRFHQGPNCFRIYFDPDRYITSRFSANGRQVSSNCKSRIILDFVFNVRIQTFRNHINEIESQKPNQLHQRFRFSFVLFCSQTQGTKCEHQ